MSDNTRPPGDAAVRFDLPTHARRTTTTDPVAQVQVVLTGRLIRAHDACAPSGALGTNRANLDAHA